MTFHVHRTLTQKVPVITLQNVLLKMKDVLQILLIYMKYKDKLLGISTHKHKKPQVKLVPFHTFYFQ
jgi:hypothetical protein